MDTTPTPLSVLVIDDYPDLADSLAEFLTVCGFTARSARSGQEALDLAAAERPDVVLLDLSMPEMNGWELAHRLANEVKPPILVAITGCGTDDDRRRSILAGIDLHLVKPVEPAILVGMLRRFARTLTSGVADTDHQPGIKPSNQPA